MLDDRFQSVYSQVEIELAQSYPVINHNCEVIFFYKTAPNDEYSYFVNNIEYVFSRDIYTGEIRRVELNEMEKKLVNACAGQIIRPTLMDDEAYESEEIYYKDYEAIYESIIKGRDIDLKIACQLMREFDKLVPEGVLKDLYKLFGKQLFELV